MHYISEFLFNFTFLIVLLHKKKKTKTKTQNNNKLVIVKLSFTFLRKVGEFYVLLFKLPRIPLTHSQQGSDCPSLHLFSWGWESAWEFPMTWEAQKVHWIILTLIGQGNAESAEGQIQKCQFHKHVSLFTFCSSCISRWIMWEHWNNHFNNWSACICLWKRIVIRY